MRAIASLYSDQGATEYGTDGGDAARWIIDPIDGTMNFVRGIPVWAALIALEIEGRVDVGVVSAPAIGHRWWAARGLGAYRNGDPIGVSAISDLDDAQVSYNSFATAEEHGIGPQMADLERRAWRTRGYGDFWSFMLVAEGAVDVLARKFGPVWKVTKFFCRKVNRQETGGALLLGVNGTPIIAHGNSKKKDIANAIRTAVEEVQANVNGTIATEVSAEEFEEVF